MLKIPNTGISMSPRMLNVTVYPSSAFSTIKIVLSGAISVSVSRTGANYVFEHVTASFNSDTVWETTGVLNYP